MRVTDADVGVGMGQVGVYRSFDYNCNVELDRCNRRVHFLRLPTIMVEGVGFEPTREREPPAGFQDRCLQPLGHPSNSLK